MAFTKDKSGRWRCSSLFLVVPPTATAIWSYGRCSSGSGRVSPWAVSLNLVLETSSLESSTCMYIVRGSEIASRIRAGYARCSTHLIGGLLGRISNTRLYTYACGRAAVSLVFAMYRKPSVIYCDSGQHFDNDELPEFLHLEGIALDYSPSSASKSTGMVEVSNKLIEDVLRK